MALGKFNFIKWEICRISSRKLLKLRIVLVGRLCIYNGLTRKTKGVYKLTSNILITCKLLVEEINVWCLTCDTFDLCTFPKIMSCVLFVTKYVTARAHTHWELQTTFTVDGQLFFLYTTSRALRYEDWNSKIFHPVYVKLVSSSECSHGRVILISYHLFLMTSDVLFSCISGVFESGVHNSILRRILLD